MCELRVPFSVKRTGKEARVLFSAAECFPPTLSEKMRGIDINEEKRMIIEIWNDFLFNVAPVLRIESI